MIMLACSSQASAQTNDEDKNKVDPILGKKQTYRPLSPYLPPTPPPAKKVSELPDKRKKTILKLKALHDKNPENIKIVVALGKRLFQYQLYELRLGPNVSTTPLRKWGFRQCLPFSWTTDNTKR